MAKKIGRNAPCPCGSGKKYKKCCLGKEASTPSAGTDSVLSVTQFCQFIEWGLKQQSFDFKQSEQKIRVKSVKLLNNMALSCEFYPYATTSADIKVEIGGIMSFLAVFLKDTPSLPITINDLAVSAYTTDDEQIMYAMSSIATAELITQEKPLEWLANTYFQDASEDFRQSRAKTLISEIENALRKMICDVLLTAYGANWWDVAIGSNIKNNAQSAYQNQTGASTSDGEKLVYYTYLLQLKTVIVQNWTAFNHIFPDQTQFTQWINALNQIRRDEAHNRPITAIILTNLEQLYSDILENIAKVYPDIVSKYLVSNWHLQLQNIATAYAQGWKPFHVKEFTDIPQTIVTFKDNIKLLENTETRLLSVVVPPGKKDLHGDFIKIFNEMRKRLSDVVLHLEANNFEEVKRSVVAYDVVNKKVAEFKEKAFLSEL